MRNQIPITSQIMLFCNHRISKELQHTHFEYKRLPVENLTQFLSASLDFLNKIIIPFNLNSVTESQGRLVDDFHSYIHTADSMPDILNVSEFEESESLPNLYKNISSESLISLYIDELPQSIKCIYYKTESISDDYCKRVIALFYLQLIKLHNYLPVYLEFENHSIVNKLVTGIFSEHLSCIPDMIDTVALSVQEIYHITQTLMSVLDVAQLLQFYDSVIGSLPQDKEKIIIDKITYAPMADKVKLLSQMLKNEHSDIECSPILLHAGKLLNTVLLNSNKAEMANDASGSYSKRTVDTLNDAQEVSNKKLKTSSLVCISDHQYARNVHQYNEDIVDQNYAEEILVPSVFDQQQDVADDSDKEVKIIGTVDGIDIDINSNFDYIS